MLIRIASQYQSPRSRLEFVGSNHCLHHLDRITDENLFATKRNGATEIAYRRVLIDFNGSAPFLDYANNPLADWILRISIR
jgi:hypothetical protein